MTISILALEKDLFFSVKIQDTLKHHGMQVTIIRTLSALTSRLSSAVTSIDGLPDLLIINTATQNLDWEAAIRLARAQQIPVLAFGSHMDLDARARALAAGAQKVVANSKFASAMAELVERLVKDPSTISAATTADAADDTEEE